MRWSDRGQGKLLTLLTLAAGSRRFSEIVVAPEGITDKALSKSAPKPNKFLTRAPARMAYRLAAHGRSLEGAMDALHCWAWRTGSRATS